MGQGCGSAIVWQDNPNRLHVGTHGDFQRTTVDRVNVASASADLPSMVVLALDRRRPHRKVCGDGCVPREPGYVCERSNQEPRTRVTARRCVRGRALDQKLHRMRQTLIEFLGDPDSVLSQCQQVVSRDVIQFRASELKLIVYSKVLLRVPYGIEYLS